jgi:Spy/CpxP family protein refolding chaperone
MAILTSFPARRPFMLLSFTVLMALGGVVAQNAQAQAGPPDHPMGGPGMMMGGPHHLKGMLDGVNATPEQRAQIRQIMQAAHDDLLPQHAAARALHQRSQALLAQPNIDAGAAEAVRQQLSANHDAVSKRMLQALLDASRVLTPEQRKTVADRMAQREAMMERHRAERDALDKAPR